MDNYFSNKNLIDMVLKWKVHLLVIAVVAGLIGIVFSSPFFMKPKYKSFAIVYPVNLGEYSEESETEQMLELLNSGDIRDNLVAKFNLDEHYNIDPEYKYYKTSIIGKYSDNFSFRKTENEAVKIEVLDTDPELARDLVNGIIAEFHIKVGEMHNAKYQEELDVRSRELIREKEYIDGLVEQMSEIGEKYGIVDITSQAEGMFSDLNSGRFYNSEGYVSHPLLKNLGKYGPEFLRLSEMLDPMLARYALVLTKHNDAYRELNKEITYSSIVTNPYVADKKFWPKRSVIVLMSIILTLILALIVIGVIENRSYSESE